GGCTPRRLEPRQRREGEKGLPPRHPDHPTPPAPLLLRALVSSPGTNSPTVERPGNTSERLPLVTANARSLPALMYSMDAGTVPNITCTWPPSRSVSAGASPRYGTWTMLTRAIIFNSSPDRWPAVPLQPEP